MTDGIQCTNATYTTATASSTLARYYGTTSTTTTTANPDANANTNMVTALAVTKTPPRVPLKTFRTVLLATRACRWSLELDAEEVKVRNVRLLNKEEGLSTSGVESGAPPCSVVHSTLKLETAGGGQVEEEEGDAKMNEEKVLRQSTKMMVTTTLDLPRPSVGSRGRGRVRVEERSGDRRNSRLHLPPAAVTPSTTTALPVNAVLTRRGGHDSDHKQHRRSRPPISASIEANDGSDEEKDGDGEILANGKENKNRKRWEWDLDVRFGYW